MKAVVYRGMEHVAVENVPDPVIKAPTDSIVRITVAAICGSNLHSYHREVPDLAGAVMGHEGVGVVEEVGKGVTRFKKGQRVIVPWHPACGQCWACTHDFASHCTTTPAFGNKELPGSQAAFIRVPLTDTSLDPMPDDVSDEDAVFLTDIFPTGFFCAENAGVKPGDTVVAMGCGPVGLMAQMAAHLHGAARVIAVDRVPFRLEMARQLGSIPVNDTQEDLQAKVMGITGGVGADIALEAIGTDGAALAAAFPLVRLGGVVSMVGVPTQDSYEFPIRAAFRNDLTFKIGLCPAKRLLPRLTELVRSGKARPSQIVTHTLPLSDGAHGYRMFAHREPGVMKVLLRP
jgi:threonine dehydrogenase-like Zn-dependent dehydrogenase